MKTIGVTRRIDSLGRIVIPKGMLEANKISHGSLMEFVGGEDGDIIIREHKEAGELFRVVNELEAAVNDLHENGDFEKTERMLLHVREIKRLAESVTPDE